MRAEAKRVNEVKRTLAKLVVWYELSTEEMAQGLEHAKALEISGFNDIPGTVPVLR